MSNSLFGGGPGSLTSSVTGTSLRPALGTIAQAFGPGNPAGRQAFQNAAETSRASNAALGKGRAFQRGILRNSGLRPQDVPTSSGGTFADQFGTQRFAATPGPNTQRNLDSLKFRAASGALNQLRDPNFSLPIPSFPQPPQPPPAPPVVPPPAQDPFGRPLGPGQVQVGNARVGPFSNVTPPGLARTFGPGGRLAEVLGAGGPFPFNTPTPPQAGGGIPFSEFRNRTTGFPGLTRTFGPGGRLQQVLGGSNRQPAAPQFGTPPGLRNTFGGGQSRLGQAFRGFGTQRPPAGFPGSLDQDPGPGGTFSAATGGAGFGGFGPLGQLGQSNPFAGQSPEQINQLEQIMKLLSKFRSSNAFTNVGFGGF